MDNEPSEEAFNTFKELYESTIAFAVDLGHLAHPNVMTQGQVEIAMEICTERRLPIPEKMVCASVNA